MTDNHAKLFLLAYEEGYSTANDPFVLGQRASAEVFVTSQFNRYLIAGAAYADYTDKGLWRVRPNAVQRLLKHLIKNHDVYGFQGVGDLRRLPVEWNGKVAYSDAHTTERVVGCKTFVQAQDLYLVKLHESMLEEFGAPSLGDAWFQSLLISPTGTPIGTDQFRSIATALKERKMPSPAAVAQALELFDGMVCYSYPDSPSDVDGPQLIIYSKRSWRSLLLRLFRPLEGQTCLFLDLSRGSPTERYALDFYPSVLFANRSVV